jgi:ribose transport system ATP-binding protein
MGMRHSNGTADPRPAGRDDLLALSQITKSFPGVRALRDVGMAVGRGQVHALLGENGAGKSTLLKILGGTLRPDSGSVRIDGLPVHIDSPSAARRSGIMMIQQELQQVPELDVTQNLFLGTPMTAMGVWNRRREMRERARTVLSRLGADIDVTAPIKTLSVAKRQLVEIGRALIGKARVIAMDEPTSSLTPAEVDQLARVIRELAADGVAIVYVSHRLEEVFELCDSATILRDGHHVADVALADVTYADVVRHMVGRDLEQHASTSHAGPEVLLSARDLRWGERVRGVSFDLHRGEILGVAGLVGAGRTELVELIAGIRRPSAGTISLRQRACRFAEPRAAIRAGIGMVPEDRKRHGIVPLLSILANTSLPKLGHYAPYGLIRQRRRRSEVTAVATDVALRPMLLDRSIALFSGGNQQKAIIARWLNTDADILIFDEPTRGIDVGAKHEIHQLMESLTARGKAILMVSSEISEILRLADRVLVMRGGAAVALLDRQAMSDAAIGHYAIAGAPQAPTGVGRALEHNP